MIKIKKENKNMKERGLNPDSKFSVILGDNSQITEDDYNWSSLSEPVLVKFGDHQQKVVMLSKQPIKKIKINHKDLETSIDVPNGCQVYQANKTEVFFVPGKGSQRREVGRIVGLVQNRKVIEERTILSGEGVVIGIKPKYLVKETK